MSRIDFNAFASWFLGIALATFTSALAAYLVDHLFLHDLVKRSVLDVSVPAYFSPSKPPFSVARKHPLVPVPILRSDAHPLSMPEQLSHALPQSLLVSALVLFILPHASIKYISAIVALLAGTTATLTLWNIFPVQFPCAFAVGVDIALRSAASGTILAWVLEDVRRPLKDLNFNVTVLSVGKTTTTVGADEGGEKVARSNTTATAVATAKPKGKARRSL
jgi:hypothetical protein